MLAKLATNSQKMVSAARRPVARISPKTTKGDHIFKAQYWMYAATGGQSMKRGHKF